MTDRFNHNNNFINTRAMDYNNEMKLLSNMESVHQRKKAAFDELLRYTYSNLKETNLETNTDEQP
ncbi:MAG TPA: hypothetical protein VEF53_14575 [Patescibacteria group bacterium]|jgi:hypothetical protein|nr:hypothetical protein [Patescibacteria group bacterium]